MSLYRQVDDLNFRLEELSVISGDQLEQVTTKDNGELKLLKQELFEEKEKNALFNGMYIYIFIGKKKKLTGDAGDRSPGLPHAKRTLYR